MRAPDDIELTCEDKKFSEFLWFPMCFYSSKRHHMSEVKNYLKSLEVKGKVSVLMGIGSVSAKYNRRKESSSKQEMISLSCSIYARKGFLLNAKRPVMYSDKGMDFNVEGIEIGTEEILIVTMEYER